MSDKKRTPEQEVEALGVIYALLIEFDVRTRYRMLNWLCARNDADANAEAKIKKEPQP